MAVLGDSITAGHFETRKPLADAYGVWEAFMREFPELDIAACMANGVNHPTRLGHTVFAVTIMNLLREDLT